MLSRGCLAVASLALLAGCSHTAISREDRAALVEVEIVPEVGEVSYSGRLPSPYEADQGNALLTHPLTAIFGVIVEAFRYSSVQEKRSETLKHILATRGIDVPEIVHRRMSKELAASSITPLAKTAEKDAPVLTLTVGWGLDSVTFLGEGWTPWLEIDGELVDAKGDRLWRKKTRSTANVELPFPDPFADSELIRRLYERVCRTQVAEMMRDLNAD